MNRDRTWQRLVRIVSLVILCFLGFALLSKASPRPQQPTVTGKSKARSVSREDIASLLQEAALLLQAGKLDQAEPLVRRAVTAG